MTNQALQETVLFALRRMAPYCVRDFDKIRVGRDNDGGYIMLDDFQGIDAAYSIGINDDVSWDAQIADYGIHIYQYDHTIGGLPAERPEFHWKQLGLADTDSSKERLTSLRTEIARNGHNNSDNLLLKIDIEDGEWNVFGNIDTKTLQRFRQIVCEFHNFQTLSDNDRASKMTRALSNLSIDHRPIHVHANNNGDWVTLGSVPIPTTLELTYVRRDANKIFAYNNEILPGHLDMPNRTDRPDFPLGLFRF